MNICGFFVQCISHKPIFSSRSCGMPAYRGKCSTDRKVIICERDQSHKPSTQSALHTLHSTFVSALTIYTEIKSLDWTLDKVRESMKLYHNLDGSKNKILVTAKARTTNTKINLII